MTAENTSTKTTQPVPAVQAVDNPVQAQVFQDMLTILNELVSHTHIFYDDYSTACNCNCNCNCSRGIL